LTSSLLKTNWSAVELLASEILEAAADGNALTGLRAGEIVSGEASARE
jgi:hypothetical protein